MRIPTLLLCALALLAGCEQLGFEDPAKIAAAKEAEGKAIGSACRQAGRAIEDCFDMNPKAQKAAVFAGWREMDGYMRDNKMESAKPVAAADSPAAPDKAADAAAAPASADAKPEKSGVKADKTVAKR